MGISKGIVGDIFHKKTHEPLGEWNAEAGRIFFYKKDVDDDITLDPEERIAFKIEEARMAKYQAELDAEREKLQREKKERAKARKEAKKKNQFDPNMSAFDRQLAEVAERRKAKGLK